MEQAMGAEQAPPGTSAPTRRVTSAPTRRVTQVLSVVVGPPAAAFTLAELCRSTGASRGTLHAVTSQLVQDEWLHRRADGRFVTGPALRALTIAAAADEDLAPRMRPVLVRLSEATGMSVRTTQIRDEGLVVVDALPGLGRSASAVPTPVGGTVPWRAPFGRELAGGLVGAELERWWDEGEVPAEHRARVEAVLGQVRRRGWSVDRLVPGRRELLRMAGALDSAGVSPALRERVTALFADLTSVDVLDSELARDAEVEVAAVSAPVLDATGSPVGAVAVTPLRRMTGRMIRRTADQLTTALT